MLAAVFYKALYACNTIAGFPVPLFCDRFQTKLLPERFVGDVYMVIHMSLSPANHFVNEFIWNQEENGGTGNPLLLLL